MARPRGHRRPGVGRRGLGDRPRDHRWAALPRDHRPPAVLRRRASADRRGEGLGRRARHLGGDRARRGRRLDRLPAARPAPERLRRRRGARRGRRAGDRPGRATGSTTSSTAGPTDVPWRLQIHCMDLVAGRAVPCTPGGSTTLGYFQPTFLYEALWDIALAFALVWADRRFRMGRGTVFALYAMGYTAGRGWIEALRTDPAHHLWGLRLNDWTAIVVFVVALVLLPRPRRVPLRPRDHRARATRPPTPHPTAPRRPCRDPAARHRRARRRVPGRGRPRTPGRHRRVAASHRLRDDGRSRLQLRADRRDRRCGHLLAHRRPRRAGRPGRRRVLDGHRRVRLGAEPERVRTGGGRRRAARAAAQPRGRDRRARRRPTSSAASTRSPPRASHASSPWTPSRR